MFMKKMRFKIVPQETDKSYSLDWNLLPERMIEENPNIIVQRLGLFPEGQVKIKSVVYVEPVRSFRKEYLTYEDEENNIIYGINDDLF